MDLALLHEQVRKGSQREYDSWPIGVLAAQRQTYLEQGAAGTRSGELSRLLPVPTPISSTSPRA